MLKLQFTIDAVDRATAKIVGINKAVEKSVERVTAPYRKLRASINGLVENSGLDKLKDAWGGVKDQIMKLPGVAAVSLGGAFAVMHQTVRRIDEMNDRAVKLGVPIQQFQRLGYAAQLSGSSQEAMAEALQHLSQSMVEAGSGSKEMQGWFSAVGLDVQKLRKMNAVQVFEAIADKFEKVGDVGQNAEKKIAFSRALMGRGGAEMIQMLNQGSGAIKKLYDEADKFGTLTTEQAGQFAATADNLDRFEASLRGLIASITLTALPGMNAMLEKVASMNAESRKELGDKIGRFLGTVIEKAPKVLESLGQISKGLIMLLEWLDTAAQAVGGWDTLMVAFAAAAVAKGVWSLGLLAKAFWELGFAVAVTPVGWFMAAVAVIAGLAYLVWKNWAPIKDRLMKMWGGIVAGLLSVKEWFSGIWDGIVAGVRSAVDAITNLIPNWLLQAFSGGHSIVVAPAMPSAVESAGQAQRGELGGTLRIQIDSEGQAKVAEMRKASGSPLDLSVYNGPAMGL